MDRRLLFETLGLGHLAEDRPMQSREKSGNMLTGEFADALKQAASHLVNAAKAFDDARVKAPNDDVSDAVDNLKQSADAVLSDLKKEAPLFAQGKTKGMGIGQ